MRIRERNKLYNTPKPVALPVSEPLIEIHPWHRWFGLISYTIRTQTPLDIAEFKKQLGPTYNYELFESRLSENTYIVSLETRDTDKQIKNILKPLVLKCLL